MNLDQIRFDASGLVPAIVQDAFTGRVLMLAYMNRESLEKTLATGHCWFFSRSRQQLWEKGATSGNYQHVRSLQYDCDGDALLLHVHSAGPACHTGAPSCFSSSETEQRQISSSFYSMIEELAALVQRRDQKRPADSYTTRLFEAGLKKIAQKVGEEGLEVALAALVEEDERVAEESADLLYHLLVLWEARKLKLDRIGEVLQTRAGKGS